VTALLLDEFECDAIVDRLEGWELADFLQIPIDELLATALENNWINEENVEDLLDYIDVKRKD
jgi:hypothetical protein